jgi:hypothetical protein
MVHVIETIYHQLKLYVLWLNVGAPAPVLAVHSITVAGRLRLRWGHVGPGTKWIWKWGGRGFNDVYMYVYISMFLSIYLSNYLSIYLPIYLFISPSKESLFF